jgi:hypothetical protein
VEILCHSVSPRHVDASSECKTCAQVTASHEDFVGQSGPGIAPEPKAVIASAKLGGVPITFVQFALADARASPSPGSPS